MFGVLDIIIILLVLLCIIIGSWRGLIGSLAKLLDGFLKLVISIILTRPMVAMISKTKIDEQMFGGLSVKFASISDKFNVNLVGMAEDELSVFVGDALSDAKIPKIFRGLLQNLLSINPETISTKESVTLAELMGVSVGNIILLVYTFVVLCLLLWLISKLALRWSRGLNKKDTVFAKTNKWLGGLFGLIKSFVVLFIAFIILSAISDFAFMHKVVEYVNNSFIGGPLYRLSNKLIENSFNVKALTETWLINK